MPRQLVAKKRLSNKPLTLTEIGPNNFQQLPLLDFTKQLCLGADLENTYFIAQQHIVPTTGSLFEALFQLGLSPTNISLIGKCYSTDLTTFHQLRASGIDISDSSYAFDSHYSFDKQYTENLKDFLLSCKQKILARKPKKIILLDDGGDLIIQSQSILNRNWKIVGIEQTSAGYNKLKAQEFTFPIINIARCKAKLQYEAPIIAELSIRRLFSHLSRYRRKIKRILIIGAGVIGSHIYDTLNKQYDVTTFDIKPSKSMLSISEFESSLNQFDLIIGCSGNQVFKSDYFQKLKQNTILASLSSSDREFNAAFLRNKIKVFHDCHQDISVDSIHLLNGGFPLTFDSKYDASDEILLEKLQLTRSMILYGIFQASNEYNYFPKFISLNKDAQNKIINKYIDIYREEFPKLPVHYSNPAN